MHEVRQFRRLEGHLDFVEADCLNLIKGVAECFDVVFDQKRDEVHEDEVGDLFDVGFGYRAVGLEDVCLCGPVVPVAECGNGEENTPVFGEGVASEKAGGFCGGDGAWHEAAFFLFAVAAVGDESAEVEGMHADSGGSAPADESGKLGAGRVVTGQFGDEFCGGQRHLRTGTEAGVGGIELVNGEVVSGSGCVPGGRFFCGCGYFAAAGAAFCGTASCGFGELNGDLFVGGDHFEDEVRVGEG